AFAEVFIERRGSRRLAGCRHVAGSRHRPTPILTAAAARGYREQHGCTSKHLPSELHANLHYADDTATGSNAGPSSLFQSDVSRKSTSSEVTGLWKSRFQQPFLESSLPYAYPRRRPAECSS